jgi:hypothetical protein
METPQEPAEGIMKTADFPDAKFYTVRCDCGNSDDDIDLSIEADDTGITVNFFVKVTSNYWDSTFRNRYDIDNLFLHDLVNPFIDLINGIITRVRMTWKLWTKGHLEYNSYTVLTPQAAANLADVLVKAVEKVKEEREKYK